MKNFAIVYVDYKRTNMGRKSTTAPEDVPPWARGIRRAREGRGFTQEELSERIFLPLVSGRAEGSGLGLALAQQVAREHRGSLAYRSRPGHTVFTLLLPMDPAPEAAP